MLLAGENVKKKQQNETKSCQEERNKNIYTNEKEIKKESATCGSQYKLNKKKIAFSVSLVRCERLSNTVI